MGVTVAYSPAAGATTIPAASDLIEGAVVDLEQAGIPVDTSVIDPQIVNQADAVIADANGAIADTNVVITPPAVTVPEVPVTPEIPATPVVDSQVVTDVTTTITDQTNAAVADATNQVNSAVADATANVE